MKERQVRTQKELDAALKAGEYPILVGDGYFEASGSATVRAWDSATVRAWDSATVSASGSATVSASGSATVSASGSATVSAWDSATVSASGSATVSASGSATVRAWDSATVSASGSATVRAWDSATVRAWDSATVRASGSATVSAWDSATVRASGAVQVQARGLARIIATAFVAVTILGAKVSVEGGVHIRPPDTTSGQAWCEHHGVGVVDGVATLYKAVEADWRGSNKHTGITYRPGDTPAAPDWDEGRAECGGGLHFGPTPWQATGWLPDWAHLVACPVLVTEISAHGFDAQFPEKVKAPRVCAPCYEVDIDGKRLEQPAVAAGAG